MEKAALENLEDSMARRPQSEGVFRMARLPSRASRHSIIFALPNALVAAFREAIFVHPPHPEPLPDRPEWVGARLLTETERQQLLDSDRRVSEYARAAFAQGTIVDGE